MHRVASCCCGQLSIRVEGDPSLHGICHCKNCKKRTGSAFGMSAYFDDGQIVDVCGKSTIYEITGDKQQERSFCPICGTTLFWRIAALQGRTGVAAGCFTDNSLPEPKLTVSNEEKHEWLQLPSDWATT